MRALLFVGIALLILGIASLFVSIPHTENHGIKVGDSQIGVQTQDSERIPMPASVALILGGVVLLAVGARSRS